MKKTSILFCISLLLIISNTWADNKQQKTPPEMDYQRWQHSVLQFKRDDTETPPPKNAIVFVGSSSFTFWNKTVAQDMSPLTIIPRGFGGSTMEEVLYYLDSLVLDYQPRAVVLYEGDNDIALYGMSPEKVRADFITFVSRVHHRLPQTRIYVVSIKPSPARLVQWPKQKKANQLLKKLCDEQPLLTYVDVASPMFQENGEVNRSIFIKDNIHMNNEGYSIWKNVLRTVLLNGEVMHEKTNAQGESFSRLTSSQ